MWSSFRYSAVGGLLTTKNVASPPAYHLRTLPFAVFLTLPTDLFDTRIHHKIALEQNCPYRVVAQLLRLVDGPSLMVVLSKPPPKFCSVDCHLQSNSKFLSGSLNHQKVFTYSI